MQIKCEKYTIKLFIRTNNYVLFLFLTFSENMVVFFKIVFIVEINDLMDFECFSLKLGHYSAIK